MRLLPWIALLLLSSCIEYPTIQEIRRVQVEEYRDSTLLLETLVVLQNPNRQDIPLQAYSYDMRIYDTKIGRGRDSLGWVLPGSDTLHVPLQTELSLTALEALLPRLVRDQEAAVEIDGRYTFRLLNKDWTLHQTTETILKMDEILATLLDGSASKGGLVLRNLRIGEVGLLQSTMRMNIEIHNQFPLDYALEGLDIRLYADVQKRDELGRWRQQDTLFVAQDSSVAFPVAFRLNNLAIVAAIPEILQGAGTDKMEKLVLAGNIHLAIDDRHFVVPFQQSVGTLLQQAGAVMPVPSKNSGSQEQ